MSELKLKDNYQINMLYQQFKNQNLSNQDRFYYAKLLAEQCISRIISYPEKESKHYFDLSVINSNDSLLKYLITIVNNFDIETIELLNNKIEQAQFDKADDNQLFRRLAMLFFILINNEVPFLKENVNNTDESDIKKEIDLLISKMDTFTNNEDHIEKLEYELEDLKTVYSFNNDSRTKYKIEEISSQISELRSKDIFTNQKRLDELQLLKADIISNDFDNAYIQTHSSLENNFKEENITDFNFTFTQSNKELIPRYPDLDLLLDTDLYKNFLLLYENGIFQELESKINDINIDFLKHYNFPQDILKEVVLKQILFYLPLSESELLGIKYVGKVIMSNIGIKIIEIVNISLENNHFLKSHKENSLSLLSNIKAKKPTNKNTKFLNAYANWDRKQEEMLINCFNQKMSINSISISMQRSRGAIIKKLKRLGFDPDIYSDNSGLDL